MIVKSFDQYHLPKKEYVIDLLKYFTCFQVMKPFLLWGFLWVLIVQILGLTVHLKQWCLLDSEVHGYQFVLLFITPIWELYTWYPQAS